MKIEPVIIDENGGATKQVQELRNLYQRDNVDVVLGYIGSGDCLAVAPIAEELKKMLVLMDCGTPRIFEEAKYNYVFRTAAHATMDNVGLIRYMKAKNIKMTTRSGGNSVRVYGALRDEPALLTAFYREGRPTVLAPGGGREGAQFLVAWEGTASGWGTRPLRVDALRPRATACAWCGRRRPCWPRGCARGAGAARRGAAHPLRAALSRLGAGLRGADGAGGRLPAGRGPATSRARSPPARRLAPRPARGRSSASLAALAARDRAALAALVPDRRLRGRLPAALRAEPSCDAPESAEAGVRWPRSPTRQPWALTFRHAGARWRLTGATPVLP